MAARVAHKSELSRALDVLDARGEKLAAMDVLPGGAFRLHVIAPAGPTAQLAPDAKEAAAWDEALA